MDAAQWSLSEGPSSHIFNPFLFIYFFLSTITGTDRLLNGQNNVINCFLVIGPTEFLHCKEVQIRRVFTGGEMLTNRKKEHINDAQLRKVISLTLLATHYQLKGEILESEG